MSGSRWLAALALLLPLLLAVATAAWWQTHTPNSAQTCAAWREHFRTLDDSGALDSLRRLAARDQHALPALVAALSSRRAPLVRQAKVELVDHLNRWALLEMEAIEPRQVELLELLAGEIEQCDIAGQRASVDLALRILAEPTQSEAEIAARILAACETILQKREPAPTTIVAEPAPVGSAPTRSADPVMSEPRPAPLHEPIGAQMRLPPLPKAMPSLSAPSTNQNTTHSLNDPTKMQANHEPRRINDSATVDSQPVNPPTALISAEGRRPSTSAVLQGLGPASLVDLLSAWHDVALGERQTIERELTRRKITPRQIEIGLGLTSPNVDERRRWLDQLPRMSGIDPKPWLLWLTRDDSAEIRLAALQIMSTASEPAFQRRAGEMALGDSDGQVREVAQRISRGASEGIGRK